MFFPKLAPSQIVGQSLQIAGSFLGVSMVSIGDAVFSGPLFRDGDKVFLLHADQQPDGKTVDLRFVDIGDRATTRVLEHTAHIAALTERVIDDKAVITRLRSELKDQSAAIERLSGELSQAREAVEGLQTDYAGLSGRAGSLVLELAGVHTERLQAELRAAQAEATVQKYVEVVGPLETGPSINDEIAEQMRLMEPEEINPAPPPVVSPALTIGDAKSILQTTGTVEPGPAAYDAPGLVGETIAREGSVTDTAFARLMFLTRGDVSL